MAIAASQAQSRGLACMQPGLPEDRWRIGSDLGCPARHDERSDHDLNGFAVLIEGRGAHLDEALLGPRLRRPHLEDLAFNPKRVAGAHRERPAELLEAGTDDAASRLELAVHQE